MKNIYMVQPSNASEGCYFLPYASGLLINYAFKSEKIKKEFCFKRFVFRREDIDECVSSLEDPFFVGFSNSIWCSNYNKTLAQAIKKAYPDCIIQFGGKELPRSNAYLEEYPYIDFLIHLEGMEPFRLLLEALADKTADFSYIQNLSWRSGRGPVMNRVALPETADYPSPYLDGVFEELMELPEYKFVTAIETNRGCPFTCSYCDFDSSCTKVRFRKLEDVLAEIEWVGRHKIDYLICNDANFGLFKRDLQIAQKLVETKKKYGFPVKFQVSAAKADIPYVFMINKMLNENGMSKGATISYQTLAEEALFNVGRKNIPLSRYSELMVQYNALNIPTFTDMILGLPGETYESFCEGLGKLLTAGQHTSIYVYSCNILTNTPLWAPSYQEKYKIKAIHIPFAQYHCDKVRNEEIEEYSTEIVETSTMSRDDFGRAKLFSVCVQCFHCFGLLQAFAMYLHTETGLPYKDFYLKLLDWMRQRRDTVCGAEFEDIENQIRKYLRAEMMDPYTDPMFGNITWPLEEAAYLQIVLQFDRFYKETEDFLRQFGIEEELFRELMKYQKAIIKMPCVSERTVSFKYDFYTYFRNVYTNTPVALTKTPNIMTLRDKKIPDNWKDYSKIVVWFGRKGEKNLYKDIDVVYTDSDDSV